MCHSIAWSRSRRHMTGCCSSTLNLATAFHPILNRREVSQPPGPPRMADRQRPVDDLILQRLTKTFLQRGKAPVQAVNGIDLTVGDGELLGLLGPSGCGKSTTLRMIAGLEEPTMGDIRIAGRSIVALPPHERNVAVAFENYALFPPLTVEENIAFGMRARKEAQPRERAREVAQRLGIS